MIFAIDYDGTIADTNREKSAWILRRTGRKVAPWDCSRTACVPLIGLEAYEEMSEYVYERESTLAAAPVSGALDALRTLARHGEIRIVSARPWRRIEFAGEWLMMRGVKELIAGYATSADGDAKLLLCGRMGAGWLIDDDRRHLVSSQGNLPVSGRFQEDTPAPEEMAGKSRRKPFTVGRIWLQDGRPDLPAAPEGVHACLNWGEALRVLLHGLTRTQNF